MVNGFVVTKNADGSYRDNYAGCGTDGSGNFVRRTVGIGLDDLSSNRDYRLRYQTSPLDGGFLTQVAGTAYIKVYHPTTSTWILEPEGTDDPTTAAIEASAFGAKLEYTVSGGFVNRGNYHMPFRFTLTTF